MAVRIHQTRQHHRPRKVEYLAALLRQVLPYRDDLAVLHQYVPVGQHALRSHGEDYTVFQM